MARTLLDLDEGLLAEAAVALGAHSKKDTVTLALQRVVDDARAWRARGLAQLVAVADSGGFDFDRVEALNE